MVTVSTFIALRPNVIIIMTIASTSSRIACIWFSAKVWAVTRLTPVHIVRQVPIVWFALVALVTFNICLTLAFTTMLVAERTHFWTHCWTLAIFTSQWVLLGEVPKSHFASVTLAAYHVVFARALTGFSVAFYKGRVILVPIVPKIAARWRQIEFCIFCTKSRQNERSSLVCSLNVNKLSREFFHDFFLWKISSKWKEFYIV